MNDNLVDQLRALSELHQQGNLTAHEFETAKSRLLAIGAVAPQPQPSPSVIVLQNELADLDRQWTLEREKYTVSGRYGSSIPEAGSGKTTSIVMGVFGTFWTIMAVFIVSGGPIFMWLFPLFGVFFVTLGISKGNEITKKAEGYKRAEEQYKRRRAELAAKVKSVN